MAYLALYRQWRPRTFDELVGQEHVSRTLRNALAAGRVSHAYLLCGPRGTGKTSTAKILAKAVNCLSPQAGEPCNECARCVQVNNGTSMDVLEIDAASNRGIDEIRDLREKVRLAPAEGRYRVYVIDEVHMLTNEAFNALLKTLEEPPPHAIFILATTEPQKLPLTVLSRCQRFDFRRIGKDEIAARLREVANQSGVVVSPQAIDYIARSAAGGMRDALSLLDQCLVYAGEEVTMHHLREILGAVDAEFLRAVAEGIAGQDREAVLLGLRAGLTAGKDVRRLAGDLAGFFRDILILRVCGDEEMTGFPAEDLEAARVLAGRFESSQLVHIIDALCGAEAEMRWSTCPEVLLELVLLKEIDRTGETVALERRVTELERQLGSGQTVARINPQVKEQAVAPVAPVTPVIPAIPSVLPGDPGPPTLTPSSGAVAADRPLVAPEGMVERWPQVLEAVKKAKLTTYTFLIEAEPVQIDQQTLILSFPPERSFHKSRMEQPDNRQTLEGALQQVYRLPIKFSCVMQGNRAGTSGGTEEVVTPADDAVVRMAVEIFGGELVEVKKGGRYT